MKHGIPILLSIVLVTHCSQNPGPKSPVVRGSTMEQPVVQDANPGSAEALPVPEKKPDPKADPVTPVKASLPAVTLSKPFPGDTYGCKNPYQAPWVCENVTINGVEQGSFLTLLRPGARYLLAAPHGWFDAGTDAITHSVFPLSIPAGYPVWSQLIAHSFRGNAPSGLQHNVNRPSTLTNDVCTDPAALAIPKLVYQQYRGHMDRLALKPALYFEIHGQNEPGLEANIEVATERVSAAEAEKVRKIMNEELVKAAIAGISIVIEPVDTIFFNAGQTKQCGSINHVTPGPAIHTENPRILREGDAAQLKTASFYRSVLNRLASEVFTPDRKPLPTPAAAMLLDLDAIRSGPMGE